MRVVMAHSILLLATRVVVIMFFTGLVGCGTVVVISWISIFKDGFANPGNGSFEQELDAERIVKRRELAIPVPNTKAS